MSFSSFLFRLFAKTRKGVGVFFQFFLISTDTNAFLLRCYCLSVLSYFDTEKAEGKTPG
jgi:hypothetical protein